MKIFCLVSSGLPLSDEMCDLLHASARTMVHKDQPKLRIRGSNFEGLVISTGQNASLGTVAGAVFEATLESNVFVTKVKFIVRTADLEGLEQGQWLDVGEFGDRPEPSLN